MGRGSSKVAGGGAIVGKDFETLNQAQDFLGYRWYNDLTQAEQIALYEYSGTLFDPINYQLRNDMVNGGRVQQYVDDLDSAISKSVLREPIVVHRGSTAELFGFPADYVPTVADVQGFVGRTFHDKGYVSTSAGNKGHEGAVHFDITVPAGRGRGGYLGVESAHPSESEFLLKRNAGFKVTGVSTRRGGGVNVNVQML